jgi:hypothetical protein
VRIPEIVYDSINDQGVIFYSQLYARLRIMIMLFEVLPDALLRRRNSKGTWNSCKAEFEFKSSLHGS